jgi:hypothetical protein
VPQPFAILGRDPRADVRLAPPEVGRRHAYLQLINGRVFCTDLQSGTGTSWGGGPRQFAGWFDSPQELHVGPLRIRLAADDRPPAEAVRAGRDGRSPLLRRPEDLPPLPQVTLEFLKQAARQPPWRMKPVLALLGTSVACAVRLHSPRVSRLHASLVRTPQGVWVIDLLGRGGILVNDTRVRSARLRDGDQLQVRGFAMRVRYDSPPPAPCLERPAGRPEVVRASDCPAAGGGGPGELPRPAAAGRGLLPAPDPPPPPSGDQGPPAGPLPALELARPALGPVLNGLPAEESLLLPLLNQFGQMQQQMFDQFHQGMLTMVQMFGALHRDQMGMIRDELERVYQITQELHSLQTNLAQRPGAANGRVAAPPLPGPLFALPSRPLPGSEGGAGLGGSRPALVSGEAAPPPAAGAGGAAPGGEDPHLWLNQRIAAIQHERQGRWQKILNYLRGGSADSTP